MKKLYVKSSKDYEIIIEHGIIKNCGEFIKPVVRGERAMIISDSNVYPIYGGAVTESLESAEPSPRRRAATVRF